MKRPLTHGYQPPGKLRQRMAVPLSRTAALHTVASATFMDLNQPSPNKKGCIAAERSGASKYTHG
jgi:hypothetical protein